MSERKTPEVAHFVRKLLPGINVVQKRRKKKEAGPGGRSFIAVGEFLRGLERVNVTLESLRVCHVPLSNMGLRLYR